MDSVSRKTTILFPPELHSRLVREARRRGLSLGRLIRDVCEKELAAGAGRGGVVSEAVAAPAMAGIGARYGEVRELAEELALESGMPPVEAALMALRDQLGRMRGVRGEEALFEDLMALSRRCAALPVLDSRPADEILGYDEHGLPS
jgi:antitoxin VapB